MLKQKPGVAVVIFPGGAAEALVTEQFKYKLVRFFWVFCMQDRVGFRDAVVGLLVGVRCVV